MKYKIENFAHQELNQKDFTDVTKLKERIEKKIEPFQRPNVPLVDVLPENIDERVYNVFKKCCKV
jgi:hypothetical protein